MTEDKILRFSNVRHRSRGGEDNDDDNDDDDDARLDGARLDDNSPAARRRLLRHTVIVVLVAVFLHQRLRGRERRGTATPDTAHILDEGGWGIESKNQQLWGSFSAASAAE